MTQENWGSGPDRAIRADASWRFAAPAGEAWTLPVARPGNDPGLVADMGMAVDGLFVGRDGCDGVILQIWSRRVPLNTSLPVSAAVLQDVRERVPGGILATLSVERYFKLPEGSPMVAALLDELGVSVAAQWGSRWPSGIGTDAPSPSPAAAGRPAPGPRSRATAALDNEHFFKMQELAPRSRPVANGEPAAPGAREALPQEKVEADVHPAVPPRTVLKAREDEPPAPFMQYLFGDLEPGDVIRVEVEDTALEIAFVMEAPGLVSEKLPTPSRARRSLMISSGRTIALLLPRCQLVVSSAARTGALTWHTEPLRDGSESGGCVSRPA